MRPSEAIKIIKGLIASVEFVYKTNPLTDKEPHHVTDALTLAISALEKLEQTKEAIPHRNYQYLSDYWCECGWHLGKKGDVKFCADCGRRIKWD